MNIKSKNAKSIIMSSNYFPSLSQEAETEGSQEEASREFDMEPAADYPLFPIVS